MADPLSLTASIIAVVGAAEGVSKTIAKIRSLQHASNEAMALINEVADIRIILYDVESYVTQNARWSQSPPEQLDHMNTLLNRAKDRLLELDKLIQYQLVKPESTNERIKVSRREWVKAKDMIKNFRRSLRDIKLTIIAQIVVLNSLYQSRIGLAIEEFCLLSSQFQADQLRDRTTRQLEEHTTLLSNILSSQGDLRDIFRLPAPIQEQTRLATQLPPVSFGSHSPSSTVLIRARRFSCTASCRCACHKPRHFMSPKLLSNILGRLFIGYSGFPLAAFQHCSDISCQARRNLQTSVNYLFPFWLLSGILALELMAVSNKISVSLTFRRLVPIGAEVFRLTVLEDTNGLKSLFSKGLASPNDIGSTGVTPLMNAVRHRKFNSCRFLLQAGSDPRLECVQSSTALDKACNMIFKASMTSAESNTLRSLFPISEDYLEERQFSKLHMTVLGLASYSLTDLLALCYSDADVDAFDSEGNTALMWAARRGDTTAVKLLLKAKANPNSITFRDVSPLLFAAQSSEPRCVKLLLEAGADPTHETQYGWNALHYAVSYQNNKEVIEYLILGGIDVNGRTRYSDTPLGIAAVFNNSISAEALLDHGAEVNTLDNDGNSPLCQSIYSHADDMTQLLLDRGAFYTSFDNFGFSILHVTAMSGGLRTIEILLAAKLSHIDPDALDRKGKTALQISQQRGTKEEEFVDRFELLLADIRVRNASLQEQTPQERSTDIFIKGRLHGLWTRWKPSTDRLQRLRSMWPSILLYWILGLGWAGFVYMVLLDRKRVGESKDNTLKSKGLIQDTAVDL